ncbi:hypothetical protein M434DRAFT_151608 [Hypoxylon sp. CO27-5]|nr:hypothetical protein M434DRAFT_151608 [Hypoxylon sp. CO27-5]
MNPFKPRLITDPIERFYMEESPNLGATSVGTWLNERSGRGLKPGPLTEEAGNHHLTIDIKDDGNAGTEGDNRKHHDLSTTEAKNKDPTSLETNPEASDSRIGEVHQRTSAEEDVGSSKQEDTGLMDKDAESERPTESTTMEGTKPPSRSKWRDLMTPTSYDGIN